MSTKFAEFIQTLPEAYRAEVEKLDDEDIAFLKSIYKSFDSYKELINLVKIGEYVNKRRDAIVEQGEGDEKITQIIETYSATVGVPVSTIFSISKSAQIFGAEYLYSLAEDAKTQGIRMNHAMLRELNRLDSSDWAVDRQAIISQIFNGELLTSRQVQAAVDALLGITRKATLVPYEEDGGTSKSSSKGRTEGDALDPAAGDIQALCVQLVDLINAFRKKSDVIGTKITDWRENETIENLMEMDFAPLETTRDVINEFIENIKDIEICLDEAMKTVVACQCEI